MSKAECQLVDFITKENYGEKSAEIINFIQKYGPAQLFQITSSLREKHKIQLPEVKHLICNLIHHNVLIFDEAKPFVEYQINQCKLLSLVKSSKYLLYIKLKFGETGFIISNEILIHGRLDIISIVSLTISKLQGQENAYNIKDVLFKLISCRIIRRSAWLNSINDENIANPTFIYDDAFAYNLPVDFDFTNEWEKHESRSLLNVNEGEQPKIKRIKADQDSNLMIYWCLNVKHLDHLLLGQIMAQALESRYLKCIPNVAALDDQLTIPVGDIPGLLSKSIFSTLDSATYKEMEPVSRAAFTFTINQIVALAIKSANLRNDHQNMIKRTFLKQLTFLSDLETCKWVLKIDETAGGTFRFDMKSCVSDLFDETVYTFIRHRFGAKAARIYKLIQCKGYTEQKRIEECAMMSAKLAKELLYLLLTAGFVKDLEVSKTPDYAPSRTFYLFNVDRKNVARRLLDMSYRTYYNLANQRDKELADGERLFDKRDKIEAIINTLLADQGSDYTTQIAELRDSLTPHERLRMSEITASADKLDCAQMALDETITILTSHLRLDSLK